MILRATILGVAMILSPVLLAQQKPVDNDIPPTFTEPPMVRDFTKRVEMVPMRDGTKLYTVIVIPNGAKHAPILLTRTPYDAAARAARVDSPRMIEEMPLSDEVFVSADYVVFAVM